MGKLLLLVVVLVALFLIFSPDKLPRGVGLKPVPVTCDLRPSTLTLFHGSVGMFRNTSGETYHNVKLVCVATNGKTTTIEIDSWAPGEVKEVGAFQNWVFEKGETATVYVSGYCRMGDWQPDRVISTTSCNIWEFRGWDRAGRSAFEWEWFRILRRPKPSHQPFRHFLVVDVADVAVRAQDELPPSWWPYLREMRLV